MRIFHSFRFKLSTLYLLTIIVPTIVIMIVMPYSYKKILVRNSMNETSNTIIALRRNMEAYLDDLENLTIIPYLNADIMNALKVKAELGQSADMYTLLSTNRTLTNSLENYMRITRDDIEGTILIAKDGTVYLGSKGWNAYDSASNYPYREQAWYRKTLEGNGKAAFISSHPRDYISNAPPGSVFSVARIIKDPDTEENLAFIMADADTRVLQKIVSDIRLNFKSSIAVLDDLDQVIYSTSYFSPDMLNQIAARHATIRSADDRYLVVDQKLEKANWRIVVLISQTAINDQFTNVHLWGVLYGLGGVIFTIVIFLSLSRWIIAPLNEMIEREYRAQLDLRNAELNLRNAEFRSLQAQLQPHFLYNVLNGFIGLNRLGQKQSLENAIVALSKMLRYILLNSDRSTIKEEFEFLNMYCDLQRMRFQQKGFEYRVQCDSRIESFYLPKLLLQPLIENSIIHGIEPINRSCLISISANRLGDLENASIEIVVEDDGAGFEPSVVDPRHRVGLVNVQERLRLAYPHSGFLLASEPGVGTKIVIRIPIQEEAS
ncbi:sensor histidine kinase [Cohnella sp. AR92]|uniref:sensor histidine kinase n=1 Tax=Cohnella sp. AR92 TaxID=648716 RepID=UPI000F8F59A2|nr:sensor histidine kinase [Cohnella sp. AR92]RUS43945.1 sensor histidine kinase [Cohnella sp. AR92]